MIKKIFFWDGFLTQIPCVVVEPDIKQAIKEVGEMARIDTKFSKSNTYVHCLDAKMGPTRATSWLESAVQDNQTFYVLTNFLEALKCDYIDSSLFPEGSYRPIKEMFYLWDKKQRKWRPIEEFTDKELRSGHNLAKLYYNGAFDI